MSRVGKYQDQFFPEVPVDEHRESLDEGYAVVEEGVFSVRSDHDHVVVDKAFEVIRAVLAEFRTEGAI